MPSKLKIKKGDEVLIIAGQKKGIITKVNKVYPKERKLALEGVLVKRHIRPSAINPSGLKDSNVLLDISNVVLLAPETQNPVKVSYSIDKKVKKRVLKQGKRINK
jgi:large subunit ribosomal protein L24